MKVLFCVIPLLFVQIVNAQDCEWQLVDIDSEMTRMLSKPIDIGGKEYKKEMFFQGFIKDNQRFLIVNFKDSSIKNSGVKRIMFKTDKRIYAFPNIQIDSSKFDLGNKIILYDASKPPKHEMTYLSENERADSVFKIYFIPIENINSIQEEEITSILIGNIELYPSKRSLKRLQSMIKCIE